VSGLTFGVVPGAGIDAEHLARLEDLPIDALWMGGHVASPNPSPEVMMALAVLGARTRRVRIGTSILLLPLYAPAIVAKQVADLDNLTGGRVTLGVGIGGEYPGEFRACQVPIGGARAAHRRGDPAPPAAVERRTRQESFTRASPIPVSTNGLPARSRPFSTEIFAGPASMRRKTKSMVSSSWTLLAVMS
jgi:Luciferase-like monooxygenase